MLDERNMYYNVLQVANQEGEMFAWSDNLILWFGVSLRPIKEGEQEKKKSKVKRELYLLLADDENHLSLPLYKFKEFLLTNLLYYLLSQTNRPYTAPSSICSVMCGFLFSTSQF